MKKNINNKQLLFEMMNKVAGMSLNEEYTLSALIMPEAKEVEFIIDANSDDEALMKAKQKFTDETNKGMKLGSSYLFKGNINKGKIN